MVIANYIIYLDVFIAEALTGIRVRWGLTHIVISLSVVCEPSTRPTEVPELGPHGILDVSSAASSSQVKWAFDKLSLKYHRIRTRSRRRQVTPS